MSGSLNKVTLIGTLGADPEMHYTKDGKPIASLRIATSESWKDRATGEKREKTEWHSVVIYSEGIAGIAAQYLRKGSKVFLEGRLQTRKWQDKNGNDRYTTEIVLQNFNSQMILLTPQKQSNDSFSQNDGGNPAYSPRTQSISDTSSQIDDDIPF